MARHPTGRRDADKDQPTALPAVNTAVELHSERWRTPARSRVEDVAADALAISRPVRARDGSPAEAQIGEQLTLTWTAADAMYEVAVQLAEQFDDPVPTWALSQAGAIARRQRREAFRLPLQLSALLGTDTTLAGLTQVHDLSESGARCTPPSGASLVSGQRVWLDLPLPGGSVRLDGEVVRICVTGEVGISFVGVSRVDADAIRGFLYAEQLARRARLAT